MPFNPPPNTVKICVARDSTEPLPRPPGQSWHFQAAYDIPAGMPKRLQYRGFEVNEMGVDLE
jgi:hypothetical protein